MSRRLDIILFGASGFTGKRCIAELHRLTKSDGRSLTWGIAGRSLSKLQTVLWEYQKQTGEHLNFVPIIVADVSDQESLKNMTAQAKIVINCCGPYRFYGEPVVKACLETGTHQVDVTGEPQYMETIQLKYHKAAQAKGIYIVNSCGFDSIPADLGVIFLQKNFRGTLNSVESYMTGKQPNIAGSTFNYATWESAIHGVANANELSETRRKLYSTRLPNFQPKLKLRTTNEKIDLINGWAFPFLGADRSVIQRTQRYLYEQEKIRPVQIQTYQVIQSRFGLMKMKFFVAMFLLFVKSNFGRNLLLKYPEFFTAGTFSHQSPPEEKMENTMGILILHGKGWDESIPEIENESKIPPNKSIIGYVEGTNPGYGVACFAVTLAAITILTESDKLPERGGVYSPGAAFAKTSLLSQLQRRGLIFEIRSKL